VLVNSSSVPFECEDTGDGLRHAPKKLLAFLDVYEAPPRVAQTQLDEALAAAAKSGRVVMLSFGAPWCGWCHRLEDWARSPEVAPVLGKAVLFAKIDVERAQGGQAMMERFRKSASGGIPWFCFLAADGSVLATSDVDGNNLGCPWSPEEKAAFDALLAKHASALTAEDRAAILALLGER
jgi:thiol-disulfide isomerase/thioredoxin